MKLRRRTKFFIVASALGIAFLAIVAWNATASMWVRIATSVVVYRLDPQLPKSETGDGAFPIRPYESWTPILEQRLVTGADATAIRKAFLTATESEAGGALCHEPPYGLAFYCGPFEIYRTSVCFECNNYYDWYRFEYGWRTFSPRASELLDVLNGILPLDAPRNL